MPFTPPPLFDSRRLHESLRLAVPKAICGTVWSVDSQTLQAADLPVPIGAHCDILRKDRSVVPAQAIGFQGSRTLLSPIVSPEGIYPGSAVHFRAASFSVSVGNSLLGSVLDARGLPMDEQPFSTLRQRIPTFCEPPPAVYRSQVDSIMTTGIRAIDALLTIGNGQRFGISADSQIDKSFLLGTLARGTSADVIVAGLIGNRGCQVQEFLTRELDEETRKKCVTVVSTSDQPCMARVLAAHTSTAIAEYFRDQGKHVLLLLDSFSSLAMASDELNLGCGHPSGGNRPPSEIPQLQKLIERAGPAPKRSSDSAPGSITGMYTLSTNEAEASNDLLHQTLAFDGGIHLSRTLAEAELFPAIDVGKSFNRLQRHLVDESQLRDVQRVHQLVATFASQDDFSSQDRNLQSGQMLTEFTGLKSSELKRFICQDYREQIAWSDTLEALRNLAGSVGTNELQKANPQI